MLSQATCFHYFLSTICFQFDIQKLPRERSCFQHIDLKLVGKNFPKVAAVNKLLSTSGFPHADQTLHKICSRQYVARSTSCFNLLIKQLRKCCRRKQVNFLLTSCLQLADQNVPQKLPQATNYLQHVALNKLHSINCFQLLDQKLHNSYRIQQVAFDMLKATC